MEILRRTSKSGKVFRIIKTFEVWDLYDIEYLKIYKNDDGSEFHAWFPLFEPSNVSYDGFDKAQLVLKALLQT